MIYLLFILFIIELFLFIIGFSEHTINSVFLWIGGFLIGIGSGILIERKGKEDEKR